MTQDRIALFETESIPKAVLKLSIPTVLSSLVMIIYSLADTFYVGMMNDSVQNAAVTLAAPVLLAFNAVNNLFGVGSSSMISRALGRKDYKTAYQSSAFGIYCSLFFGLLFGALSLIFNKELLTLIGATDVTWAATEAYMRWTVVLGACPAILNVVLAYLVRAEGTSLNASIGTMSGCVLNIILDPFFVLPQFLGMGAEGAALATLLSNTFSVLYFAVFILVKRGNTYVTINPKYFVLKKAIILGVFAVGIPAAIQNLLNVTGMTLLNNITSTYGADAVASMGIAQRLNHVPINIAMGFTHGIMPLVGYCFAAGNYSRMKNTVKCTAKVCASCLVCASLIYYLAAPFLVSMFMKKPEIVSYGTSFLRGFCLGLPFVFLDFVAVGVFQATGKGLYSLLFAVLRKIVFEIPAILILNHFFPLYGLAYSQCAAEILMSIIALVCLIRIFARLEKQGKKIA